MKIKHNKIIIISCILILASGIAILGKGNENPLKSSEIIYKNKANKDKPISSFLAKEQILDIVEKYQRKTTDSYIESVKLKTWKEHFEQDEKDSKDKDYQTDPNRMVWVVITKFPSGLNTKAGFYDKATLITVYDAETGDLLESFTKGDYKGNKDIQK